MRVVERLFCLITILVFTGLHNVNAQVAVERSKEKTIISGQQYYLHTIKKGETVYSISRAYNVTVDEVTKNNPQAVYSVREGEVLIIPYREEIVNETIPNLRIPEENKDYSKYSYHIMASGETIYSLSKLYGVSESDILSANSGIDVTKLSIGTELTIPRRDFKVETQKFVVQDTSFFFHRVKKGETLSSIADYYNMPLRELRRENKETRFPVEDDMIRVPSEYALQEKVETEINFDSLLVADTMSEFSIIEPDVYTPVSQLSGSLDVAVLLPFFLKENSVRYDIDSSRYLNGQKIYRNVPRQEEWMYSRSIGFVEMYQGILLAVDTLREAGLNINLHTFDVTNDTREMSAIINQGKLRDMDLIIGPVYSSNLAIVADYATLYDIPVVSPVQLLNESVLAGNPTLFVANPFLKVAQQKIIDKVADYKNANFVFIHNEDTSTTSREARDFKDNLLLELSTRIPYDEIRFKEFFFYNRSAFNNDSISRISHAINNNFENIVIIASEDVSVISETLQEIHSLSKKNNIHIYGYPIIRSMDNLEPRYLFDLDLCVYSPFWIDYRQEDVKAFVSSFREKFLIEPEEMSYAWSSYDIAFYFISGLAIHGKDFIKVPSIHNPDLIETKFNFVKDNVDDGFKNNYLYPIRYTRDYDVKLEE